MTFDLFVRTAYNKLGKIESKKESKKERNNKKKKCIDLNLKSLLYKTNKTKRTSAT